MYPVLKTERKKRKITQNDMALQIGLKTGSAYHKKECGEVPFTILEAMKVSEVLGMDVESLFKREFSL